MGGSYKKYRQGILLSFAGDLSANIKVNGDTANERTLRLSSIRKSRWSPINNNNNNNKTKTTIEISREEYEAILAELETLRERFKELIV